MLFVYQTGIHGARCRWCSITSFFSYLIVFHILHHRLFEFDNHYPIMMNVVLY